MLVAATICARGGSKGVPGKCLRSIGGRPLLAYTIECARACRSIDHIVFSTDSDEIAKIAESCGLPVSFRRPPELATDEAPKIGAIRHAIGILETELESLTDIVVDLDVGVPLRAPADIDGCIALLSSNTDLDAAVTIYPAERNPYFNMVEVAGGRLRLAKTPAHPVTRRQDAPRVYSVTPSVFAFRRSRLGEVVHLYDGAWGGYPVPRARAIDVDDELDLRVVETLIADARNSHLAGNTEGSR